MFYLLAIVSMLGYSLQEILLIRFARKIDGLSLGFYRNISFIVTLSPLLLFVSPEQVILAASYWRWWILACLAGGISMAMQYATYKYLAVGVANSVSKAANIVLLTFFSWIFFKETISPAALLVIIVIASAGVTLGILRNHMDHLTNEAMKGIAIVLVSTIFKAITFLIFLWISRQTNPLASSYIWESGIGIATIGVLLSRHIATGKKLEKVDSRTFFIIAASSAPTLIGTAGLAMAVEFGPIGVASAIGSAGLITTSLLAWKWYKERLRLAQWAAIGVIAVGVALLKFV